MTNTLLLIASVIANLFGCGILRNSFCKKQVSSNADLQLFNALSSAVSAVAFAVYALFTTGLKAPSFYTVALGTVFGIITALAAVLNMKALKTGPLSYTTVIISCSMIIPALSGLVLYSEPVSVWQFIGTGLMIISITCAVDKKNDKSGASGKWLLFCLGAFLFTGSVGIMQKLHQSSEYKGELTQFLITAFAVSSFLSLLLTLYYSKAKKEELTVIKRDKLPKYMLFSLICGVFIAFCNQVNLYLSGAMNSIIFFPVVNGGSMLLSTLSGIFLFKERLSAKQWVGIGIGAAALLLLCNIIR